MLTMRVTGQSYFEAIRLTLIMFAKFGAKICNIDETGIILDHKPMKEGTGQVWYKISTQQVSVNKEVTTVIADVNTDGVFNRYG